MKAFLQGFFGILSCLGLGSGIAWAIIGVEGDSHHHQHHWALPFGIALTIVSAVVIATFSRPFFRTRVWRWIMFGYAVFMTVMFVAGLVFSLIDAAWLQAFEFCGFIFLMGINGLRITWRDLHKETRP